MDKVSEPLLARVFCLAQLTVVGHVERPLAEKSLRVGRHVREVVHHHKHLDHRAKGVEQGHLDSTLLGHPVTLLAQVDVT